MCVGVPGRIVEITDSSKALAKVDVAGIKREICIACIVDDQHPIEHCIGDWVLIHVGFAMGRIDEEEARKTLELLIQLGEAQREIESMSASLDEATT